MCPENPGEFDLIKHLTGNVKVYSDHVRTGIGDDCAVIAAGGESDLLLTSDIFLEAVHFKRRWFLPEQIGGKAFRAGLSDIAAMGGSPAYGLVSLAVPVTLSRQETESLYRGIRESADAFEVTLLGGDLSRSGEGIVVDIMLIGQVEPGHAVLRSGARPGDRIFVSGNLGEAALGLKSLEAGLTGPEMEPFIARQRLPEPRISLGRMLSQGEWATAMIDISDGLSSDLNHLCEAGSVGAKVAMGDLPLSETWRKICDRHSLEAESMALHGGEDYELLFTVPSARIESFKKVRWPIPVTEIGEILPSGRGVILELPDGRTRNLEPGGYDHFRSL